MICNSQTSKSCFRHLNRERLTVSGIWGVIYHETTPANIRIEAFFDLILLSEIVALFVLLKLHISEMEHEKTKTLYANFEQVNRKSVCKSEVFILKHFLDIVCKAILFCWFISPNILLPELSFFASIKFVCIPSKIQHVESIKSLNCW